MISKSGTFKILMEWIVMSNPQGVVTVIPMTLGKPMLWVYGDSNPNPARVPWYRITFRSEGGGWGAELLAEPQRLTAIASAIAIVCPTRGSFFRHMVF